MPDAESPRPHMFPRWANLLGPALVVALLGGLTYVTVLFTFGASPKTTAVGYAPVQPVAYSHAIHVGRLGLDCRYCHTTVESAPFAAIPPTQTCMNCHASVRTNTEKTKPIKQSWESGRPIEWVKVHDLPDYVYFNHSAHVNKGVGCVSCHGRIDTMNVVRQVQPLSMSWCLDCHRNPEQALRPLDKITDLAWQPPGGDQLKIGLELKAKYKIRDAAYMTSCTTCHR